MAPIKRIAKPGIVSKMPKNIKLFSGKQLACDIFPENPSEHVQKLDSYPVFKKIVGNVLVKAYVFYMEKENGKIYFLERPVVDKYVDHFKYCGKVSRHMVEFIPHKIDWSKVKKRYESDTSDTNRSNIDTRVAFRMKNMYLVKAFFTFGQRTVAPETAHVIQTLNVPLIFFLKTQNVKVLERLFPYNEILLYDRRILEPKTCFRIPPNTTYFIVSTQKILFSVDIVSENYDISFEYVDPVAVPCSSFTNYIDLPVKTPYANLETAGDYECSDNEDDEQNVVFKTPQQSSFNQTIQQNVYLDTQQPSFNQTIQQPSFDQTIQQPSFDQTIQQPFLDQTIQQPFFHITQNEFFEMGQQNNISTFNGYNSNNMINMLNEFYSPVQQNPTNNQQVLYSVISEQNSPIFEKNILVATRDFVTAINKIMKPVYPNPKLDMQFNDAFNPEPLDLSMQNDTLDIAMDTLLQEPTLEKEIEMDEIISDLLNTITDNNE